MAPPNPALRIPPSGPLAGGNTSPINEYAGAEFLADQEVVAPGTLAYLTARIGSTDEDNSPSCIFRRAGTGVPQAAPPPDILVSDFLPMGVAAPEQAASDALGLTAGIWLVEAFVSMGFNTSLPDAGNCGGLIASFDIVSDDNSILKSVAANALDDTPRAISEGPAESFTAAQVGVVHSTIFRQLVTISQAEIDANNSVTPDGAPFRGLQCTLTRVTGSSVYDQESGWLEFTRNCKLKFRRFR